MAKPKAGEIFSIVSVGSYSIKALRCVVEERKIRVLGWKTHRNEGNLTTQSPFADYLAELEKAMTTFQDGLFGDFENVHFMFSSSFMIVKILGAPGFARSELKNLIKDKLERDNAIASRPGGLETFKYVTTAFEDLKDEDKIEEQMDVAVLTLLAEHEVLNGLVQFGVRRKIVIGGIWSEVVGTAGLVKFLEPQLWKQQVAVVNVGHSLTTFQIFSEGKCLFYRPIFTAGQAITNDVLTITNDETIDIKQAEELKHKISLSPTAMDMTSLTPLEALIHTISEQAAVREFSLIRKLDISFEYLSVNLKKRITKVLYTGGTANLHGLVDFIAKSTTLPPGGLMELESRLALECELPEGEGKDAILSFATAFGLACSLKEEIYPSLDFYRSDGKMGLFRPEKLSLLVRQHFGKGLLAVEAAVLLYFLGQFGVGYYDNHVKIEALRGVILTAPKFVMRDPPEDLEELTQKNTELHRHLTFYDRMLKTRVNWIQIHAALAAALPPEDISLVSLELGQRVKAAVASTASASPGAAEPEPEAPAPGAGSESEAREVPTSIDRYEYDLTIKGVSRDVLKTALFAEKLQDSRLFKLVQLLDVGDSRRRSGFGFTGEAPTRNGDGQDLPFSIKLAL